MASLKKFAACGNSLKPGRTFSTNTSRSRVMVVYGPQDKKTTTNNASGSSSNVAFLSSEFPLPGNVTTQYQYEQSATKPAVKTESCLKTSDVLKGTSNYQRQMQSLRTFASEQEKVGAGALTPGTSIECSVHECPQLLKKEFSDLFTNVRLNSSPLTMINMAQKTQNDMGVWSVEMEAERDNLTAEFISNASAVCDALREAGYWADFIDPSSGRPYLGPFTNATLFETDGRLERFGFDVEDLGCCKVISHHLWGRQAFVGTLFTSAPLESPAVQNIMASVENPN